ncbi:MAG: hypothetical protein ABII90_01320 [Bacteroidota bacterium]
MKTIIHEKDLAKSSSEFIHAMKNQEKTLAVAISLVMSVFILVIWLYS